MTDIETITREAIDAFTDIQFCDNTWQEARDAEREGIRIIREAIRKAYEAGKESAR